MKRIIFLSIILVSFLNCKRTNYQKKIDSHNVSNEYVKEENLEKNDTNEIVLTRLQEMKCAIEERNKTKLLQFFKFPFKLSSSSVIFMLPKSLEEMISSQKKHLSKEELLHQISDFDESFEYDILNIIFNDLMI